MSCLPSSSSSFVINLTPLPPPPDSRRIAHTQGQRGQEDDWQRSAAERGVSRCSLFTLRRRVSAAARHVLSLFHSALGLLEYRPRLCKEPEYEPGGVSSTPWSPVGWNVYEQDLTTDPFTFRLVRPATPPLLLPRLLSVLFAYSLDARETSFADFALRSHPQEKKAKADGTFVEPPKPKTFLKK